MYDDLEYLLRRRIGNIVYIPNDGNAGDSFIAHATYQFFARLGLQYEIGSLNGFYPDHIIIYAGGGNLVPYYHSMAEFITRHQGVWRELIILPHTIRGHADVLSDLRQNCFVFCREKASYDFVLKYAPNANTFLSHDLAFGCDFDVTRKQFSMHRLHHMIDVLLHVRSNLKRARYFQKELTRAVRARKQPEVLNAFRVDVEKTPIELPEDNIDISRALTIKNFLPTESLHTTFRLLQFITEFQVVRTNRLHVGIMSAMLGLEVHFYDNSYGKNRDTYIHSMQGRFPNVHWHTGLKAI